MTIVKSNGSKTLRSPLDDMPMSIPAVNISEEVGQYLVEMAVPGMKREDFKISLDDDLLTISASTTTEHEERTRDFTRQEYNFNSFTRSFQLPNDAIPENVSAEYTDGVLKIKIARDGQAENHRKREISVN